MIRKSAQRFSEKIMRKQAAKARVIALQGEIELKGFLLKA